MKKLLIWVSILLLSSFASATFDYDYKERYTQTNYYPQEDLTITVTKYSNYENDKRLSTYDYRHGYTYRETSDYWEKHPNTKTNRNYKAYSRAFNDRPDYYYKYVPYLREYQKVKCYDSPPSGKIIYIKCP